VGAAKSSPFLSRGGGERRREKNGQSGKKSYEFHHKQRPEEVGGGTTGRDMNPIQYVAVPTSGRKGPGPLGAKKTQTRSVKKSVTGGDKQGIKGKEVNFSGRTK